MHVKYMHHTLTFLLLYLSKKLIVNIGHTQVEPAISAFIPINRLLKIDRYHNAELARLLRYAS